MNIWLLQIFAHGTTATCCRAMCKILWQTLLQCKKTNDISAKFELNIRSKMVSWTVVVPWDLAVFYLSSEQVWNRFPCNDGELPAALPAHNGGGHMQPSATNAGASVKKQ